MLLSLQAYERAPTLQAESALIQAAQQPLDDLLSASGGPVDSVAFSPDGHDPRRRRRRRSCRLVGRGDRAEDRHPGRRQHGLQRGVQPGRAAPWRRATSAAMSACGTWRPGSGPPPWPKAARSASVAFSPDGQHPRRRRLGGHVGLWDVATGRRTATLTEGSPVDRSRSARTGRPSPPAMGAAMSACGTWRPGSGPPPWPKAAPVYSVAFSPDGHTLAAGDTGGHVGLWDATTGRRTATLAEGTPSRCGVQP